ncbi:uncharacterized protein LOC109795320 isoform X1 [Cajanus cajan]|uniref:uncharacterized protein LOC109795320 isoform X2 n=1 Tax=Cajanus cajan TaxID=3821 RepID=UPI00098DA44E|nr:uncharacterized protein LOC109795320 isoform X2 [Cajanus cajan]XP_029128586.1 uncharacterized protein LOC109795320 isoform X1 [Cajanus cajan]
MWRLLTAVTRNLNNTRKSSKVADESMFEQGNGVELFGHDRERRRQHGWGLVCSILQAPISILSCVSHPQVNGSDIWVTGEFSQVSEMNHLMVSDSMRYAILM